VAVAAPHAEEAAEVEPWAAREERPALPAEQRKGPAEQRERPAGQAQVSEPRPSLQNALARHGHIWRSELCDPQAEMPP
jgi:hypothetical protein